MKLSEWLDLCTFADMAGVDPPALEDDVEEARQRIMTAFVVKPDPEL